MVTDDLPSHGEERRNQVKARRREGTEKNGVDKKEKEVAKFGASE
jgi:hypothetical protein